MSNINAANDISMEIRTSILRNTQWKHYAPTEGW